MGARAAGEDLGGIIRRLEGLAEALSSLSFVSGTSAEERHARPLERARRIARFKLLAELERGFAPPLVAVISGGTNVGKSSLFNAILERPVSSVDARAGHTVHPVAAGDPSAREALARFLSGYTITDARAGAAGGAPRTGSAADAGAGPPTVFFSEADAPGGAVLVDSPDVDSALRVHHARAEDVLVAADVLLLVTSPTKYNDRRCVEFLLDAAAMGKRIVVLFNLLPPEPQTGGATPGGSTPGGGSRRDILDDFRRSVLARLPKGAAPPVVFEFDAVAGGGVSVEERTGALAERALEARSHLGAEAARAGVVKREVAAGAARYLARSLEGTMKAMREQARSIEAVRAGLDDAGARAAAEYEAFLRGQEFLDLELVLNRLLGRFRVPVLDDVLDLVAAVPKKLVGAILRRPSLEERRKEQRRATLAKEIELVSRARVEFARTLEARGGDEVARKVYGEIVTVDYFDLDLAAAWTAAEPKRTGALDAWRVGFEGELASRIERSPKIRVTVQSLKAVLQLGAGVGAAVLTGGIGAADVVIGPAATKAAQLVLKALASEYFRSKREEYLKLARSTFEEGLEETFLRRLRDAVPDSPRAEDVDAVERELRWLAGAFPPQGGFPSQEA